MYKNVLDTISMCVYPQSRLYKLRADFQLWLRPRVTKALKKIILHQNEKANCFGTILKVWVSENLSIVLDSRLN